MFVSEVSKALWGCGGVFATLLVGTGILIGCTSRPAPGLQESSDPVVLTPEQHRFAVEETAKTRTESSETIDLADLPPMDDADRMIGAVINLNGHLCARPTLVQPTGSQDLYAVQCITYRSGKGISNYLVNSRTNEVTKI